MTDTTAATIWDEIAEQAPSLSSVHLSSLTFTLKRINGEALASDSEELTEALRKMAQEEWDGFAARAIDALLEKYDLTALKNLCQTLSLTYRLNQANKKNLATRLVGHFLNERAGEAKRLLDTTAAHARNLSSMRWLKDKLDGWFRKIAQEEGSSYAKDYSAMDVHDASRQAVRQCARIYAQLRGDDVPDPINVEKGKYADDADGALKETLQYALTTLLRNDMINNKSSAVQTRLMDLTRNVGYMNGYRWVINACGYCVGQDADYSYPHVMGL